MSILENMNCVADLRTLPAEKLPALAEELRAEIIRVTAANGGHLASNLGVVEMTIALLRVFDPGAGDKILFDVSHQAYAYKILTGRRERFATLRRTGGLSGFQKRGESAADAFGAGHAGTSISAGLGFAAARDARGGAEAVVAVVGDASLSNGVSLEALNNISTTGRMIIVLNDNQMSIGKNVGGLSRAFGRMLSSPRYNRAKESVEAFGINRLKLSWARAAYHRSESALKSLLTQGRNKPFESMGLRYIGPVYGHDTAGLVNAFEACRRSAMPVLLHVGTQKGRGFGPAEKAPERWHSTGPFDPAGGARAPSPGVSWSAAFGAEMCAAARADGAVAAITAGMCEGCGLDAFHAEFPARLFDVGICEEHQFTFAAGLAAAGMRPVAAVYSTFAQRAVDAVIHDIALQKLPVLICLDRAGAVPNDGATHHGVFDIALLRPVPGLVIMQPRDIPSLRAMMRLAFSLDGPAVIRYPRADAPEGGAADPPDGRRLETGRARVLSAPPGAEAAIWTLGPEDAFADALSALLAARGLRCVRVDARFAKPIDGALLAAQAAAGVKTFVTVEDGVAAGGFGSAVEEFFAGRAAAVRVVKAAWPDEFMPHATARADLAARFGFTPEAAAARILDGR